MFHVPPHPPFQWPALRLETPAATHCQRACPGQQLSPANATEERPCEVREEVRCGNRPAQCPKWPIFRDLFSNNQINVPLRFLPPRPSRRDCRRPNENPAIDAVQRNGMHGRMRFTVIESGRWYDAALPRIWRRVLGVMVFHVLKRASPSDRKTCSNAPPANSAWKATTDREVDRRSIAQLLK